VGLDFDALPIEPERAVVEILMLANWAEIVNQLIYVMGGGVDTFFVPSFPFDLSIWVVISVLIPWSAAGRCQSVRLWLHDADGQRVGKAHGDQIWMERTADMAVGQPFRHMMAYLVPFSFPRAGTYRITASVGDTEPKGVAFQIRLADPATQPRREPPPTD
jgi:hypothetical protein